MLVAYRVLHELLREETDQFWWYLRLFGRDVTIQQLNDLLVVSVLQLLRQRLIPLNDTLHFPIGYDEVASQRLLPCYLPIESQIPQLLIRPIDFILELGLVLPLSLRAAQRQSFIGQCLHFLIFSMAASSFCGSFSLSARHISISPASRCALIFFSSRAIDFRASSYPSASLMQYLFEAVEHLVAA